jgi:hypothetical protein
VIKTTRKLKSFASGYYSRHPEMVRSAVVSSLLMPTGFALLYIGVSVWGWRVESFGLSYIAVRWALNFTIGPLSYVFNKRLIFRGSSPLTRLTSQLVTSGILLWIEFRLWLRKRLREVQKT